MPSLLHLMPIPNYVHKYPYRQLIIIKAIVILCAIFQCILWWDHRPQHSADDAIGPVPESKSKHNKPEMEVGKTTTETPPESTTISPEGTTTTTMPEGKKVAKKMQKSEPKGEQKLPQKPINGDKKEEKKKGNKENDGGRKKDKIDKDRETTKKGKDGEKGDKEKVGEKDKKDGEKDKKDGEKDKNGTTTTREEPPTTTTTINKISESTPRPTPTRPSSPEAVHKKKHKHGRSKNPKKHNSRWAPICNLLSLLCTAIAAWFMLQKFFWLKLELSLTGASCLFTFLALLFSLHFYIVDAQMSGLLFSLLNSLMLLLLVVSLLTAHRHAHNSVSNLFIKNWGAAEFSYTEVRELESDF